MSHTLYLVGRFAARRPWIVIGAWVVAAVIVIGASSMFGQKLDDSFGAPGLDSQKATDLMSSGRSDRSGLTAQVVLTPLDAGTTFFNSARSRAALTRVQDAVSALPHVLSTNDPAGFLVRGQGAAAKSGAVSPDGRIAVVDLQYPELKQLGPSDLRNLEELAAQLRKDSPLQIELGGDLFFAFEQPSVGVGELLGIVAAVVILLVAFGSLIAMGLPIGLALFGLALGVSSMSLVAYLISIPSWVPVIGSMVGLGVGIDYALFLVTRQREHLAGGLGVVESVGRAAATAGHAIVFAGGTVVISILGLAAAGVPFMTAGGIGVSMIVSVMVLASVTLLPAFLGLVGRRVDGRAARRRARRQIGSRRTGWERWGEHVSKHAAVYVVAVTAVLLALAAPVLALRVGTPDAGSLPQERTERRAYDLVASGFGPGVNGPLVVAVDVSRDRSVVQPLFDAVSAERGIASVCSPAVNEATGVATLVAFPTTGPQDDATEQTIQRLRTEVFPSVLAGHDASAHIGGQTATVADVGGRVNARMPLFIGAVILLSVLLLTVLFRSILIPLKAAMFNLLSIGASFGVMVMVFEWGWGANLIGLETTVPILPFIPMFMFAVVFGLSMDYEVFLLSRVREEYEATGDPEGSVISGIARTGRVITSAALIMICVFLGFVANNDPTTKMFGLGLSVAILVDATVVRMILVPATLKLFGHAAWWLPSWLDRLLPAIVLDRGQAPAVEHDNDLPSGHVYAVSGSSV